MKTIPTHPINPISENMSRYGLTKREYFAALIMAGNITVGKVSVSGDRPRDLVRYAVRGADLLIEELNKDTES